jgi:adenine phosphoribosyltransferase
LLQVSLRNCAYGFERSTDLGESGGSAKAAADLVKQLKGDVTGFLFILEIPGLNGRDKLEGVPVSILMDDN